MFVTRPSSSRRLNPRWLLVALVLAAPRVLIAGPAEDETPRIGRAVLRFAEPPEAAAYLGSSDAFVEALGPLDLRLRLGEADSAWDRSDYLELAASRVLAWTPAERENVARSARRLSDRLSALGIGLELPEEILLIKTTGEEEANLGNYTRGDAIIVPAHEKLASRSLVALLAHEGFHLATRTSAALRRELYPVIGFAGCGPVELPAELAAHRITNPDAFVLDGYVQVEAQGRPVAVTPVPLVLETQGEGSLLRRIEVRLLAIEPRVDHSLALREGAAPVHYAIGEVEGFFEAIGRNTGYIVHPEEILADHFMFLAEEAEDLPNPEIVDRLAERLREVAPLD